MKYLQTKNSILYNFFSKFKNLKIVPIISYYEGIISKKP